MRRFVTYVRTLALLTVVVLLAGLLLAGLGCKKAGSERDAAKDKGTMQDMKSKMEQASKSGVVEAGRKSKR